MLKQRRNLDHISKVLMCIVAFLLLINICNASMLFESKSFLSFIDAIDPENELNFDTKNGLVTNICLHKLKGVTCNIGATTITEIWLDNRNLSGVIDANSLCNLPNLRVLNLAKNRIHGKIPGSISRCTKMMYMNLSSNLLTGNVPVTDLVKLQNLKRLDISRNRLRYDKIPKKIVAKVATEVAVEAVSPSSQGGANDKIGALKSLIALVLFIGFFFLLTYFVNKRAVKCSKEREILKYLAESPTPNKFPLAKDLEEGKQLDENNVELLFFVDGKERFKMGDLLEAEADLQGQGLCSSLYKVRLKTSAIYAVKRLKQSPVSFEEFSRIMRKIGDMKHQNILPLVGYGSTGSDTKLLIYNFQKNGSLLSLLEKYIEGKRDFPWKSRVSIAVGIARGLEFIHQTSGNRDIIPHGDIKLSNILLDENDEALISEYGYSRFLDPKKACLINSSGYTPPDKSLSEQGDVYSFGVILLELLTGKIVEKSGLDLPKWVRAMVREEWTGEVLDKEIAKNGKYAFPLLNISLQCVAQSPEKRPSFAEVLEQIEEIANVQDDFSPLSSIASVESTPKSLMHSVVPEEWDTPGSYH